jgi:hypothetical protein
VGKLSARKRAARFETCAQVFDRGNRPVCIELGEYAATVRLKGCRRAYTLGYDAIFWAALRKAETDARAAKRAARRLAAN